MVNIVDEQIPRIRPFTIVELISMIKMSQQGIILCTYDNNKTLDFFQQGLRKIISEDEQDIAIYEQEKNKVNISNIISNHSNYTKYNTKKIGFISNAYKDNDIPSFELLNQARSFYTKINYPIIFWFYAPCIPWLYRFAPDFMRVQIAFFEFTHKDTVRNSKLLGLEFPKLTRNEERIEFFKKESMKTYSAKNLQDARKFLQHISKILNLEFNVKDLEAFAIEMIETKNEHLLLRINDMIRSLISGKGRNRIQEDQKYSKYCKQISKKCKKLGRLDMSELYEDFSNHIDVDQQQLFQSRK